MVFALAPGPLVLFLLLPEPDRIVMNSGLYNRPRASVAQEQGKIIYQSDSYSGRIAVMRGSSGLLFFAINGKPDGSTSLSDMYTQLGSAHLAALSHPNPSRVLVIGLGTGTSAGSLTLHPEVKEIHVVEIDPAILDVARRFAAHNSNVMSNPRVHLHLDDARHFLLTDSTRYDLILSEPSNLWVSGMVNLYTREFYQLIQRHLQPGGVFLQWVHYYQAHADDIRSELATFQSVFAHATYWAHPFGDSFLLARDQPLVINMEEWQRRLQRPALIGDFQRIQLSPPLDILGFFLWGSESLSRYAQGARICTDDFPFLEFTTPRVRYSARGVKELFRLMQAYGPVRPLPLVNESATKRIKLGDIFLKFHHSLTRCRVEYRRALQLNPESSEAARKLAHIEASMGSLPGVLP